MNPIIAVLPFALTVAFTMLPIVAVLVILLGTERAARGWMLTAGYAAALAAVLSVAAFGLVRLALPRIPGLASIETLAGLALLVLVAVRWWRRRGRAAAPGHEALASRLEHVSNVGAFVVGVQFAFHPENVLLTVAASARIADAGAAVPERAVAVVVFTAVSVSTVVIPTVVFAIAGRRARPLLEKIRDAIIGRAAAITDVLLIIVGLFLAGDGIWRIVSMASQSAAAAAATVAATIAAAASVAVAG